MRFWKMASAVGVLAALAASVAGAPPAEARANFAVKRFLLGRLEANTYRFIATGGRGTSNAFRDNIIMFVFSAPVEFGSLDEKTVQVRIPTRDGLAVPAEGEFYRYTEYGRDEASPTEYIPKRAYRNRFLFDPIHRFGFDRCPMGLDTAGLRPDTTYEVTLPGVDGGAPRTVEATDGALLPATFATTFTTTDRYLRDQGW